MEVPGIGAWAAGRSTRMHRQILTEFTSAYPVAFSSTRAKAVGGSFGVWFELWRALSGGVALASGEQADASGVFAVVSEL